MTQITTVARPAADYRFDGSIETFWSARLKLDRPSPRVARGRLRVNTLPLPPSLATLVRPPWSSTKRFGGPSHQAVPRAPRPITHAHRRTQSPLSPPSPSRCSL